jgi:uncharacterized protein with ACT and thioredoxin-like domain
MTAITENYMTLSFIHVYFSSKPSNGYKIFEKEQGENKKEIKWEIQCLKTLIQLEIKHPQDYAHLKEWI